MKLIGPQTMRDVTTLRAEGRNCVLIVECVACMCVYELVGGAFEIVLAFSSLQSL